MTISILLEELGELKERLNLHRQNDSQRIKEALDVEYTYESNRIEGNTLTLMETELVVHKGLTISGKPLKDHLEAINHTFALDYMKDVAQNKEEFSENVLLNIHRLILRNLNDTYAGRYRDVQVLISGSQYIPPQPYLVQKQMEDYFLFYSEYRDSLHPVLMAAELHERLVTIHPFIDGNGRTARLIMNLILIRNGYPIAILKGDDKARLSYYGALENAQIHGNKQDFHFLVAETVKVSLERYLTILGG